MQGTWLRHLKNSLHRKASQMACNSRLYSWSLSGKIPDKLLFSPVDLWPGDAEKGRWIIESGTFSYHGDTLQLHNADWEPEGVDATWIVHMHGFEWLRDFRALGGDVGRKSARAMIQNWIEDYYTWHEVSWRPDIIGRRLSNWIASYDFFGESADDDFQELFLDSVIRQARHLARSVNGSLYGLDLLYALKGLAYAGITIQGREAFIELAMNALSKEIKKQILPDGGHISKSPQQLLEVIQILLDIRTALKQGNYPALETLQKGLNRAIPALRFFRHGDRHFALFHGSQKGSEEIMKIILQQANVRAKPLNTLAQTGYEKISQGRAILIMDTSPSAKWPYDDQAHSAPLSFEFSYGRERIFVNCGSHPTSQDWRDALRSGPAHNTLILEDRNIEDEASAKLLLRKPRKIITHREDWDGACLIDACHDGYLSVNGITHRRRLYMADQGHDFRGEESLNCATGLNRPVDVCVRFHIHPRVLVSLVQDGNEALLRLRSGVGWRFTAHNGHLSLDNSIYLEDGIHPRKTKQLVITTTMDENYKQIKWAFQQETA